MQKNILNDITLVIPTHNRHAYLTRILESYKPFDIKIIIADSSEIKYESSCLDRLHVQYVHTPNLNPFRKVENILNFVVTKYIVLCADDDFIFPNSIVSAIDFLEKNADYVSTHGSWLAYKYLSGNQSVQYNITDYDVFSLGDYQRMSVDSNSIENRLVQCSKPYRYFCFGVMRTSFYKNIGEILKEYEITEFNLYEVCQTILIAISGKVHELDELYHLREDIVNSGASVSKVLSELIKENHPQIQKARKMIQDFLILNKVDATKTDSLVDIAFNTYIQHTQNVQEYHRLRPCVRIIVNKENSEIEKEYLNNFYKKQPYLKVLEEIIKKHAINSGYFVSNNQKALNISKEFNILFNSCKELQKTISEDDKIVIYGAGNVAELFIQMFKKNIVFFVDKEYANKNYLNIFKVYSPDILKETVNQYNKILISVLGREEEIEYYLKHDLQINAIICKLELA